jgi:hypothetical protein
VVMSLKKLAIVQVALGVLIVGSLVFWSLVVLEGYLTVEATVPQGDVGVTVFRNPGYAGPLEIWRFGYPLLGLLVAGFGIAQYVSARRRERTVQGTENRLAIVQIALGTLVVASLIWFIGWLEFDYGSSIIVHEGIEIELHHAPGWYIKMIFWKVVSFILGLAVITCGAVQLRKDRG